MTTEPAPFDQLAGIGPATAAKLHHAGIVTWDRLAEVTGALAGVRSVTPAALRAMSRAAEARHAHEVDDGDGRRREAFAVRLELGADGTVTRSGAVHVGSQRERQWAGWMPEEFATFVAETVGAGRAGAAAVLHLVAQPTATADRPGQRDHALHEAGPAEAPAPPNPRGMPAAARSAAARSSGDVPAATPATEGPVLVPAGKVVGGGTRAVQVAVPAALQRADAPCYRARLRSRLLGHGADVPTPVAEVRGEWADGTDLTLAFPQVALPPGVHLLDVAVEVWAAPTGQAVSTSAARTSRYTPRV